jgi:phage gp29-like protein
MTTQLPNSYAALGRQLPARRITGPVAPLRAANPAANPSIQLSNLAGWITPAAQTRWLGAGVAWYTPQRCEMIFRQALAGDIQSQWEMFDLMETTWPELLTCLGQLKDEIVGAHVLEIRPFSVRGSDPTPRALERQAFVQECFDTMHAVQANDENDWDDTLRDLLDARAKGISVLEVDFETRELSSGLAVAPRCTRWVHPHWYGYPYGAGACDLMLRPARAIGQAPVRSITPGNTAAYFPYTWNAVQDWEEFPEHKFIIGICKSRTGHPLASGLLHALAFWWAAANFTADWFFTFAQINGQPFRWATYDPNMTPTDQTKLQAVLENMGASAWGMFPAGTTFELKEMAKAAGENPNVALLGMANRVCRLLILRQTLTADVGDNGGGSKALGEVHERVEGGVVTACARWAAKTLTPLCRSLCLLNYGDDQEAPHFGVPQEKEDAKVLAETLKTVSDAGFEPKDEELTVLGKRLTFAIQRKAPPPALDPEAGLDLDPAEVKAERDADGHWLWASAGGEKVRSPKSEVRRFERVVGDRAEALAAAYKGAMAPFRQIILASKSRKECEQRLAEAYADWKPERLAGEIEHALQICAAAGAREGEGKG